MPIVIVLILAALGVGWLRINDAPPPPRSEPIPVEIIQIEAVPPPDEWMELDAQRRWQQRCKARFEQALQSLDEPADIELADGEPALDDGAWLWRDGEIRTRPGDNPGGGLGVLFVVRSADGEQYAAGVSGPQPQDAELYPHWHSFNQGAYNRVSWFRDHNGRSGFIGAVSPPDTLAKKGADGIHGPDPMAYHRSWARRFAFLSTFQPAVDDCLSWR